jgi:hypothetical protein
MRRTRFATASVALTALLGLSLGTGTAAHAETPLYIDEPSVDALATDVALDRVTFGGVSLDEAAATLTVRYDDQASQADAERRIKKYSAPFRLPGTPATKRADAAGRGGLTAPANPAVVRQFRLVLVKVSRSLAELDGIRAKLGQDPAWNQATAGLLAEDYVDVVANQVAVGVTRVTPAAAAAAKGYGDVVGLHVAERPKRESSRVADFEPWTVGIRISSVLGGCTSGFVIRNTASGVKRMVTAGHCGVVGTAWSNGPGPVGMTVARTFVDGGLDVSYIGGRSYEPWSYIGGPTSELGQWITGTYLSLVGRQFCVNGATSGEVCTGTVGAIDACVVFDDGIRTCFLDVLSAPTRPGDSGGPVINTAALDPNSIKIGGIIIGGGGGTTYFHSYHYLVPSGWVFDHV